MAYRVTIPTAELDDHTAVWIDGKEYAVTVDGDNCYVDLSITNATNLITYTYHVDDPDDAHTQYPTGMRVWILELVDESYTARHVPELDNILNYAGTSLRYTTGTSKGIRMISAIDQHKKRALITDGLVGYTMIENGTAICWTSQLGPNKPMVLGKSYVRSGYAYKKGASDPHFGLSEDMEMFTNTLTGFADDQYKDDLAFRPYMVLTDGEKEITIYGGIVKRSIGYICYQLRNAYHPGTEEYEYIWNIIRTAYGDIYDDRCDRVLHEKREPEMPDEPELPKLSAPEIYLETIELEEPEEPEFVCDPEIELCYKHTDAMTSYTFKYYDVTVSGISNALITKLAIVYEVDESGVSKTKEKVISLDSSADTENTYTVNESIDLRNNYNEKLIQARLDLYYVDVDGQEKSLCTEFMPNGSSVGTTVKASSKKDTTQVCNPAMTVSYSNDLMYDAYYVLNCTVDISGISQPLIQSINVKVQSLGSDGVYVTKIPYTSNHQMTEVGENIFRDTSSYTLGTNASTWKMNSPRILAELNYTDLDGNTQTLTAAVDYTLPWSYEEPEEPALVCSPNLRVYYDKTYKVDPTADYTTNYFNVTISGIAPELVQSFGVKMKYYLGATMRPMTEEAYANFTDTDNTISGVSKVVTIVSRESVSITGSYFSGFLAYTDLDGNTQTLATDSISAVGKSAEASA